MQCEIDAKYFIVWMCVWLVVMGIYRRQNRPFSSFSWLYRFHSTHKQVPSEKCRTHILERYGSYACSGIVGSGGAWWNHPKRFQILHVEWLSGNPTIIWYSHTCISSFSGIFKVINDLPSVCSPDLRFCGSQPLRPRSNKYPLYRYTCDSRIHQICSAILTQWFQSR